MGDSQSIRLMDVAPFTVGGILVTPAARTLAAGTQSATIEPRVMQLLVALNQRRGAVVGRETLVDSCWGGRAVGEDAVNRAVLKLRRVLDDFGGSVTVETVAKVGYWLRSDELAATAVPGPASSRTWPWRRAGVGAVAALVVIGFVLVASHQVRENPRLVLIQPFKISTNDPAARSFSQDFTSDLARAVIGHDGKLEFADVADGQRRNAAFTVKGSVASVGKELHAVVAVSRSDDPGILWSHDYVAPVADSSGLRQQVSTNLAAVLVCALGTRGVPDTIDARATALYLEACNLHSRDQHQVAYLLRQVTARAPSFAGGWADLAVSLAYASEDESGQEADAMRREAADAARRALDLDTHQGNAYYAQALLLPGLSNWTAREKIIKAGLEAQPDNPQLYNRNAIDLASIGRVRDSIEADRHAVALDPLFPGKRENLVRDLANSGDIDAANVVVGQMQEAWPDNPYTWHARFAMAARVGDPREAEAMLAARPPETFDNRQASAWQFFLDGRASSDPRKIHDAVTALLRDRGNGPVTDAQLVSDLTLLGDARDALKIALRMPPQDETDFWFQSFLKTLRANPTFMEVTRRQGLLSIWHATGLWPDFCEQGEIRYQCRNF